ncbi:MAG: ABC transporter permease [Acidobacteria bacterium]|nr:ABC transporter permease [Acidobacteriota bacterium]
MSAVRSLIVGHLLHRPLRTLITVVAVGVEVCLVVIIVGLTTGLLQETAKRIEGVGADLMLQPPASNFLLAFSGAPMPIKIKEKLDAIPHVAAVAPVLLQFNTVGGIDIVYGIDLESFNRVSNGFVYHAGGPFEAPTDILVDDWYAAAKNLKVGDTLRLFENDFTVRGIVEHGKGARLFARIERLQELSAARDKATLFFIRCDNPTNVDAVAEEIRQLFPRHQLRPVRDYLSMMTSSRLPGLDTFINSMIALAVVVGFLAIFLSLYTTILERTREIGILKSLGMSNGDIIRLVLRESLLLCAVGVAAGVGLSYATAFLLKEIFPTLTILITAGWLARAALLAFLGGLLGAVYPAWLAARQDTIIALAYE